MARPCAASHNALQGASILNIGRCPPTDQRGASLKRGGKMGNRRSGQVAEAGPSEERKSYKGREIVVTAPLGRPELTIDGEPVFTIQDRAGFFIAAGFVFSPERSLVRLGQKIVDARLATEGRDGV
jgi:hypothetical protein